MNRDPYSVLGVGRDATPEQIKQAFRTLAHKYHPDKAGGDAARFKEINEAYQILSDPEKRARYDRYGSSEGPAYSNTQYSAGFEGGFPFDIGDIFSGFAGFNSSPQISLDEEIQVKISWKDSYHGVAHTIHLKQTRPCRTCEGSGCAKGSGMTQCTTCRGRGYIHKNQRTIFGVFQVETVCTVCQGTGIIPEKLCPTCKGSGVEDYQRSLEVKIPAGVAPGQKLRLSGQGRAAPRGQKDSLGRTVGDLFVIIDVKNDPEWKRSDLDIFHTIGVDWKLVLEGGDHTLDWLGEKITVTIPQGMPFDSKIKIKGKGFPALNGRGRGDGYLSVHPIFPTKITRAQKQWVAQWPD